MPLDMDDHVREFIRKHPVARLATADLKGQPAVVPICYILDGDSLYSPLDEKPKSTAARHLKRVRNIDVNPRVAVVVDDYSHDWTKLAYVLITGLASMIEPRASPAEHARAVALLREKYPQYRSMAIEERPMIKIVPSRIKAWTAGTTFI
jgi:PPOX class probable F420-dependent enzyme